MPEVTPLNRAKSTLAAAVTTSGQTTLTIQSGDASKFNSTGTYRVILWADPNTGPFEICTVNSGQGTATLTVTRASEAVQGVQTAQSSWPIGTEIAAILTKGSVDALLSTFVTSVALATPSEFSVSGSPVTSSGTLTINKVNQAANTVYSGPTSGGNAAPGFRALVGPDIPAFGASGGSHTAGGVPDPGTTAGQTKFLREDSTWSRTVLESGTAPAITSGQTITTSGVTSARVAPAAAVTGIILQAGTYPAQEVIVVNQGASSSTIAFAAAGTSNVADGTAHLLPGLSSRKYTWNSTNSLWYGPTAPLSSVAGSDTGFSVTIDGGGGAIPVSTKVDFVMPYSMTIQRVTLLADQSGSIVVDVWQDTYANFPPTVADKITASAPPTISSASKSQDATLTGWTTSLVKGSTVRLNVNSVTSIQRVTITFEGVKA